LKIDLRVGHHLLLAADAAELILTGSGQRHAAACHAWASRSCLSLVARPSPLKCVESAVDHGFSFPVSTVAIAPPHAAATVEHPLATSTMLVALPCLRAPPRPAHASSLRPKCSHRRLLLHLR
jgi:hypothetical protein